MVLEASISALYDDTQSSDYHLIPRVFTFSSYKGVQVYKGLWLTRNPIDEITVC